VSTFWSVFIILGTLGTLIGALWLLFANRTSTAPSESTGHVYDGIEEYDNPLPRWWVGLFVAALVFAAAYLVYYPGLGNFRGIGGWTSKDQLAQEIADKDARCAAVRASGGNDTRRTRRRPAGAADRPTSLHQQLCDLPRHQCARRIRLPGFDRRRVALGRQLRGRRTDDHERPHRSDAGMAGGARRRRRCRRHGAVHAQPFEQRHRCRRCGTRRSAATPVSTTWRSTCSAFRTTAPMLPLRHAARRRFKRSA
jgi:hypothetical protein